MSKYRINVLFDLDKPKEANAAQYLQALNKSRNAFMVTAVLNEMQQQTSTNGVLLDDIRRSYGRNCRRCRLLRHLLPLSRHNRS